MQENDQITFKDLDSLLLDEKNPRLPESIPRTQQAMLDYIADSTAIEELMGAIAENDYFPGEPIIVVPHAAKAGKFIVVEGNRRYTALRLLQDPSACTRPGSKIREISETAEYKPTRIPVVVKTTREEVLPYLGFRHITGVKQWEPLAKARYIEQLFLTTNQTLPPRDRYGEIARAIGSRRDHIKRNLDALAVYKEIKAEEFYGIEDLNEESLKFSVLSTALADDRIGAFAGLSQKDEDENYQSEDPIVNPNCLHLDQIEELTRWLYEKDSKGKTKVGESRNLRYLAAVVDTPRALAAFRGGSPLKIVYQLTSDLSQDFIELLYQAESALTEAAGMVATVAFDDDALQAARRVSENIKLIGRELQEKRKAAEDEF